MRVPMKRTLISIFATCVLRVFFSASAQQLQRPKLTKATEERYRLQPGDMLEVQYRYSPEINQSVTFQPDGYVSLAIGGDVKVAGLNVEQARQLILRKAGERLREPEAIVILKEFQKPYFVVAGEVNHPQVIVFRKLNSDIAEVKTLDLKSIKRTSDLENDLDLQPGDIVFVPRDKITKIERFMRLASVAAFIAPKL